MRGIYIGTYSLGRGIDVLQRAFFQEGIHIIKLTNKREAQVESGGC